VAGQKFLVGGEFGETAEDQGAAVGGREMHVEHLDSCELVEHSSRCEAGRQRLEPCAQRDVQAVGQEGDERVSPILQLGFTPVESWNSRSSTRFILIAAVDWR
jgi:hypothetical protein